MYEFIIPGIDGGPDQNAIRDAVLALDSEARVDFNRTMHKVSVKSRADLAEIREILTAIGFSVERISTRD